MKIYTKTGDTGQTSLFGGARLPKHHLRIEAYGTVDELNSVLGCAVTELKDAPLKSELLEIQKQLFVLGAELASPQADSKMSAGFLQESQINHLENLIDQMEQGLAPLTQFILPGGSRSSSLLHLARTVCRRAERLVVHLNSEEALRNQVIVYLNRLSDYLFVAARWANKQEAVEDVLWNGLMNA